MFGQKDKTKRQKRQKYEETKKKTKRKFRIATSGQFCTLAMFFFLSGLLIVHYFGFEGGTHSQ